MALAAARISLLLALVALSFSCSLSYDPSPLQDFCVADKDSQVFVNGVTCKNPCEVTVDDFYFSGLDMPGNTSNKVGSAVNLVNVQKLPGLNTFGISLARIDYAPYGLNPPHTHPRATEILVVLEGSLYVGFVTTNNKLFAKVLNKGDVYVFPVGLLHFQYNYGTTNAIAFAGLSSQNPGTIRVADALFGSKPPIPDNILTKTFMMDQNTIDNIQSKFQ